MRQLTVSNFTNMVATYHGPILDKDDILALGFTTEQEQILMDEWPKAQKDIDAKCNPKVAIDFESGHVYAEYFPIALAMEKLGIRPGPSGISCCITAADGSILALKRSEKNGTCKKFLGPVAGFISATARGATIADLINSEISEQMQHEIGLTADEFNVEVAGVADVDYPIVQSEILVRVHTFLSKEEIITRAKQAKDAGLGKIAENDVCWLRPNQLITMLRNSELHVATAHAAALCLGLDRAAQEKAHALIVELPLHDHKVVWNGLDMLLTTL